LPSRHLPAPSRRLLTLECSAPPIQTTTDRLLQPMTDRQLPAAISKQLLALDSSNRGPTASSNRRLAARRRWPGPTSLPHDLNNRRPTETDDPKPTGEHGYGLLDEHHQPRRSKVRTLAANMIFISFPSRCCCCEYGFHSLTYVLAMILIH
jgi:hypothetical protein